MNLRALSMCLLAGLCVASAVAQVMPPVVAKTFTPSTVGVGGLTTLRIAITNPNTTVSLTGVGLTDAFPPGLFTNLAGPAFAIPGCPGQFSLNNPGGTAGLIIVSGVTIAPGQTCTIENTWVTAHSGGQFTNTTSAATTDQGVVGQPATATLTVLTGPILSKSFGDVIAIPVGVVTPVTFTIKNPNANAPLLDVAFTDGLPDGLLVAPGQPANSCGGVLSAPVGSNWISLSGGTVPAGGACTVTLNVIGTAPGFVTNTTSAPTSSNGGTGTSGTASITIGDVHQVRYAANLAAGDSVHNITNTGEAARNNEDGQAGGNICVNTYVFSPDEQLVACCACQVTPNGIATLSTRSDLMASTLTAAVPNSVVVKFIATASGPCNAASVTPTNLSPGMVAWGTTLHQSPSTPGGFAVTETRFSASRLSGRELARITALCGFIQSNGSGYGICKSCRPGALGAVWR